MGLNKNAESKQFYASSPSLGTNFHWCCRSHASTAPIFVGYATRHAAATASAHAWYRSLNGTRSAFFAFNIILLRAPIMRFDIITIRLTIAVRQMPLVSRYNLNLPTYTRLTSFDFTFILPPFHHGRFESCRIAATYDVHRMPRYTRKVAAAGPMPCLVSSAAADIAR